VIGTPIDCHTSALDERVSNFPNNVSKLWVYYIEDFELKAHNQVHHKIPSCLWVEIVKICSLSI
jgi:hypothetical protein